MGPDTEMTRRSGRYAVSQNRKERQDMVITVIKTIAILLVLILIVFWILAIGSAVDMPQSWRESTGEYIKCAKCSWDKPEKFSALNQPSEACRRCPFCWHPDDE